MRQYTLTYYRNNRAVHTDHATASSVWHAHTLACAVARTMGYNGVSTKAVTHA